MRTCILVLFLTFLPVVGLVAQPAVGKSMLAYGLQYHFVKGSYPQVYTFTNIMGDPGYSMYRGSKTSNTVCGYFAYTTSLLNAGGRKFFFGDYLGFSSGLGITYHNYLFMNKRTHEKSTYGHLGFLGGLSTGYQLNKNLSIGIRGFYEFRWLMYYVGADEVSNLTPFTLNWSAVGQYKQWQGDVVLGGFSGYVNGKNNIKTYSLNIRYLYGKKEENYVGTRLDLYRISNDSVDGRDITASTIGLFLGMLF